MILGTLTSNASTEVYEDPGVYTSVLLDGAFGGGTATLEVSPDGVVWTATDAVWSTAGLKSVTLGKGLLTRVTLTGATAPAVRVCYFFGRPTS